MLVEIFFQKHVSKHKPNTPVKSQSLRRAQDVRNQLLTIVDNACTDMFSWANIAFVSQNLLYLSCLRSTDTGHKDFGKKLDMDAASRGVRDAV
ncbi:hypothetical protein CsSME_00024793 [Camellia sinensis var. sinensis]